ncbi:helix-turn-helix domain-containing protein [Streptomyces sp. TR02-1]|uniref:helix-turn-helix domain-containing protein n=1 Tax=Streptomyces sp. TR02-1 TaxID=3385977 RepID=UPI0039A02ECC
MSSGNGSAPPVPADRASGRYTFAHASRSAPFSTVPAVGYRSEDGPPGLHRGLPSPYLTLVFSFLGPVVCGGTAEQAHGTDAHRAEIVVGGVQDRPAYVVQPRREEGIQLSVPPWAARTLLGVPAGELTELAGDGADILGREAVELRERLCAQRDWEERFATLARHFRRKADEAEGRTGPRPEIVEAWRWLARHRGTGSLDALADHVALSRRQLTTLFRREMGASPIRVKRLMRFQQARREVAAAGAAGAPRDLSGIAARCGFFDHSHLVRDFRRCTGLSPTGWLAEELRNVQAVGGPSGEQWNA